MYFEPLIVVALDAQTVEILKEISITGRLALGASCLENALTHFNISSDLLDSSISLIWEFTNSNDLGKWDESIREVDPCSVLDENNPQNPLLPLYKSLPHDIVEMMSDVIEIGTGNLYGGTGDYSHFTLRPLIKVIETCMKLEIPLPGLTPFRKSKFTEKDGWGITRNRSFFTERDR